MHTDKEKPTGSAGHTDSAMLSGAWVRFKAATTRAAAWFAIVLRGLS